jgi:hypothetical protein
LGLLAYFEFAIFIFVVVCCLEGQKKTGHNGEASHTVVGRREKKNMAHFTQLNFETSRTIEAANSRHSHKLKRSIRYWKSRVTFLCAITTKI